MRPYVSFSRETNAQKFTQYELVFDRKYKQARRQGERLGRDYEAENLVHKSDDNDCRCTRVMTMTVDAQE